MRVILSPEARSGRSSLAACHAAGTNFYTSDDTSFTVTDNLRRRRSVRTLKGVHMWKYSRLITAFASVAAIAAVAPAQAQQDVQLVAHVPFAFTVGGANLPSDTYRLSRMNDHRAVLLLKGDRTGAIVYTNEQILPRTD